MRESIPQNAARSADERQRSGRRHRRILCPLRAPASSQPLNTEANGPELLSRFSPLRHPSNKEVRFRCRHSIKQVHEVYMRTKWCLCDAARVCHRGATLALRAILVILHPPPNHWITGSLVGFSSPIGAIHLTKAGAVLPLFFSSNLEISKNSSLGVWSFGLPLWRN